MWWMILLGIVGLIAAVITVVLLLPVFVIIKNDDDGELIIRYKLLNKIYGDHPDPNNPIIKAVKKTTGITQIEGQNLRKSLEESGLSATAGETARILLSLLREIRDIFRHCSITKLYVNMLCSGEDAASAAINYGKCCAITYPLIGLLCSVIKPTRRAKKINIACDYNGADDQLEYEVVIRVGISHVLAAFLRISFNEAKYKVYELDRAEKEKADKGRQNVRR